MRLFVLCRVRACWARVARVPVYKQWRASLSPSLWSQVKTKAIQFKCARVAFTAPYVLYIECSRQFFCSFQRLSLIIILFTKQQHL
jgi:hypothetical protein